MRLVRPEPPVLEVGGGTAVATGGTEPPLVLASTNASRCRPFLVLLSPRPSRDSNSPAEGK